MNSQRFATPSVSCLRGRVGSRCLKIMTLYTRTATGCGGRGHGAGNRRSTRIHTDRLTVLVISFAEQPEEPRAHMSHQHHAAYLRDYGR